MVTEFLQNEYLKDTYDLKNLRAYTHKCVHCPTASLLMLQAATQQGEGIVAKLAEYRDALDTAQEALQNDTLNDSNTPGLSDTLHHSNSQRLSRSSSQADFSHTHHRAPRDISCSGNAHLISH